MNFRVPSITDNQFVNQQIPKEKTKQHSIILNVIVVMYELMILHYIGVRFDLSSIYYLTVMQVFCSWL